MNDPNTPESLGPIEFVPEVTESTGDPQYSNSPAQEPLIVTKEQTALSIFGLILALPFPILIVILWVMLAAIKQQDISLADVTMNAIFLYLLQFFVIPVLSITSIIIAFIVTIKSKFIAKKIGYISMGVTGLGLIILGLFLNHS